jgi:hypothetical protein
VADGALSRAAIASKASVVIAMRIVELGGLAWTQISAETGKPVVTRGAPDDELWHLLSQTLSRRDCIELLGAADLH